MAKHFEVACHIKVHAFNIVKLSFTILFVEIIELGGHFKKNICREHRSVDCISDLKPVWWVLWFTELWIFPQSRSPTNRPLHHPLPPSLDQPFDHPITSFTSELPCQCIAHITH